MQVMSLFFSLSFYICAESYMKLNALEMSIAKKSIEKEIKINERKP